MNETNAEIEKQKEELDRKKKELDEQIKQIAAAGELSANNKINKAIIKTGGKLLSKETSGVLKEKEPNSIFLYSSLSIISITVVLGLLHLKNKKKIRKKNLIF